MTADKAPPQSGYVIERLFFNHQSLKVVEVSDDLPDGEAKTIFGWDWRILGSHKFEVILQMGVEPTKARPEQIRVTCCGRFRIAGETLSIPVADFTKLHASTILMPYIREGISSLTSRGFYGPLYLPPLNVQALMKNMDPAKTTGARQLSEGIKLLPASPSIENPA